jgi:hypothetical protein
MGIIPDTFFSNPSNSIGMNLTLTRPEAQITPVPVFGFPSADEQSFVIPQVLNFTHDYPDHLYIYIDSAFIPQGLSIDSITSLTVSTDYNGPQFGRGAVPIPTDSFLLFDLGLSIETGNYVHTVTPDSNYYNGMDSLRFYFHWKGCPPSVSGTAPVDTFLPFWINWQCVAFPDSLPQAACHTPVFDPIPVQIDPCGFSPFVGIVQPDTFRSCDTLHFSVSVSSRWIGPIDSVTNHLILPNGLTIVPGAAW